MADRRDADDRRGGASVNENSDWYFRSISSLSKLQKKSAVKEKSEQIDQMTVIHIEVPSIGVNSERTDTEAFDNTLGQMFTDMLTYICISKCRCIDFVSDSMQSPSVTIRSQKTDIIHIQY